MSTLVTGGSGFIGTQLVQLLLARGETVRILDHQPGPPGTVSFLGDIRDRELSARAVSGVDLIYHLAAEHRDDVRPISLYDDVNVEATRHLLDAASTAGTARFVFASSVAVYGLAAGIPSEDAIATPFNDYGRTKLEAERLVRTWAVGHPARRAIIVRPSVVFGEDNRGNVHTLLDQISRDRFIMVGRGENRKSMAYVKNVAEFFGYVAKLPDSEEIYNYADMPDLSMKDLFEYTCLAFGKPARRHRLPYGLGLSAGYVFDLIGALTGRRLPVSSVRIRKFCANTQIDTSRKDASGFRPSYTLYEGLARTIRHEFGVGQAATTAPPEPPRDTVNAPVERKV